MNRADGLIPSAGRASLSLTPFCTSSGAILNDTELSEEIRGLIQACVPDVDALEVLIFLACRPHEVWTAPKLLDAMRPIRESALPLYLEVFREQGLVGVNEDGGMVYRPATPALASAVGALCTAYNERPVTLIRTVYSIADTRKIQAFADAFRLRKNPG